MEQTNLEKEKPSDELETVTADDATRSDSHDENSLPCKVQDTEVPQKTAEYPKGIALFFVMLALMLSVILISLDQVRLTTPASSLTKRTSRRDVDYLYRPLLRPLSQR